MSRDELRVVARVIDGIDRGRASYGPLDLDRDQRDFGDEGAQELRDLLFYAAAREIAAEDKRRSTECPVERGLDELRTAEVSESMEQWRRVFEVFADEGGER